MPKVPRKSEEVEAVKEDILSHALELIIDEGYKGFSMRKLAARINVSVKTIYNYFLNKDDIYLAILTKGFDKLYHSCLKAGQSTKHPMSQVEAMLRIYLDFGLEDANLYNLMFTWHVPKFKDYIGTPMEAPARIELETALKVTNLFTNTIKAVAEEVSPITDDEARFILIQFWTQAHGYIAGINNNLLDYMHENPLDLKTPLFDLMLANFEKSINALRNNKVIYMTDAKRKKD